MEVPTPWDDPILRVIPPGLPYELLPPFFKRPDFRPQEDVIREFIGDITEPPGFHSGIRSLEEREVSRLPVGPFGSEGPIPQSASRWLSSLGGDEVNLGKFHPSGVDHGPTTLSEFGDVGQFLAESRLQSDMGINDPSQAASRLRTALDGVPDRPVTIRDLQGSRVLRSMRTALDDDIIHPDDRPTQRLGDAVPPPDMTADLKGHAAVLGGGAFLDLETGFEEDKMQIPITVADEPATMHLERAKNLPLSVDQTLSPVVTSGSVIGIRCSDGVLLAADTMASFGTFQKWRGIQRLHKVTDSILIAAEGEMADFQEMQTILQRLVAEHEELDDPAEVRPQQALNFMHHVMYARRGKQDPLWLTALIAGWGKPCSRDMCGTYEQTDLYKERPFLGSVDMHGTPLESHVFATGIGNYMALPLLRKATNEQERMNAGYEPDTLTLAEAWPIACEVMRCLATRCSQCSNRIQIGTVSAGGVEISDPFYLEDRWDVEGYHASELGTVHENHPEKEVGDQWVNGDLMPTIYDEPDIHKWMAEDTVDIFLDTSSDGDNVNTAEDKGDTDFTMD